MFENETAVLSDMVREQELLSAEQFKEIQEEHERTGKQLSQIIVDFGLLSEEQLLRAVAGHVGSGEPGVDRATRRVTVPVTRGSAALVETLRQLDGLSIEVHDVSLRRPTLDDVFLSLTGREVEADAR